MQMDDEGGFYSCQDVYLDGNVGDFSPAPPNFHRGRTFIGASAHGEWRHITYGDRHSDSITILAPQTYSTHILANE